MSKILIVDDSALARKLLRKILEKMNHEIIGEAESGEKALILYKSTLPDIVTMDLVMPGMGGIEASKRIMELYPGAKIIITSSHMQNNQKSELLENGLNYLVLKPIDENKMAEAIKKITSGSGSNINMDDTAEKKLRTKVQSFLNNLVQDMKEESEGEESELNTGDKVSVSHYFNEQPTTAIVVKSLGDELTLKLEKKLDSYVFTIEDPLTLCFLAEETYKICEASIIEILKRENSIKVKIEKIFLLHDEAIADYFPSSLLTDFKLEYYNKKQTAVVKNIGPYNMRIMTKAEINKGEKISFNIYLEEKVISLNAEIADKKHGINTYEYELKITFIDLNSKKLLKSFIQILKNNYEKVL